jgi:hypothetical protein
MGLFAAAASVAGIALTALAAVWIYLRRQARQAERSASIARESREWIAAMPVERYRPMLRLLRDEDLRFLRGQPGATPGLVSRLRIQRYRTFQGYLRNLRADFQRASRVLWFLGRRPGLRPGSQGPGLWGLTIRNRLIFTARLWQVRCRLPLYRCGLASVDATRLVTLFDGTWSALRALEPSPQLGGAVVLTGPACGPEYRQACPPR